MLKGKRVFVVGNGRRQSTPTQYARICNEADYVITFNKPYPEPKNINVQATMNFDHVLLGEWCHAVCRFSRDDRHEAQSQAFKMMQSFYGSYFLSAKEAFQSCVNEVGIDRPLSGTLCLHYLVNFCDTALIEVDGMDCYAQTEKQATAVHTPQADWRYLIKLAQGAKIVWHNYR